MTPDDDDDSQLLFPEQLRIGLYVHVDLPWTDHPFTFNSFKIRNQAQLDTLRALEIERFRYDPRKSDCAPLPYDDTPAAAPVRPAPAPPSAEALAALAEKRARIERVNTIRHELEVVSNKFTRAADGIRQVTRNVHNRPEEAFAQADAVVGGLVDAALAEGDTKIHAMSQQLGEDVYFHSLNVAVLSMILGNAIHLRRDELHQLGMGALFHDIGQIELPGAILGKRTELSRAEQAIFEGHCRIGVKIARRLGLSEPALAVIAQHHERADGSGYPDRLRGNEISLYARIVAIANAYDKRVNPTFEGAALTPHEAMSLMFAKQRTQFDESLLRTMIRCLGVYPPGTLVQLNTGAFGMVISVNARQALKPQVLLHDAGIPKEAALIVDLEHEPQLSISRSLRRSLLPGDVLRYLDPREQVTYYFDKTGGKR